MFERTGLQRILTTAIPSSYCSDKMVLRQTGLLFWALVHLTNQNLNSLFPLLRCGSDREFQIQCLLPQSVSSWFVDRIPTTTLTHTQNNEPQKFNPYPRQMHTYPRLPSGSMRPASGTYTDPTSTSPAAGLTDLATELAHTCTSTLSSLKYLKQQASNIHTCNRSRAQVF